VKAAGILPVFPAGDPGVRLPAANGFAASTQPLPGLDWNRHCDKRLPLPAAGARRPAWQTDRDSTPEEIRSRWQSAHSHTVQFPVPSVLHPVW